MLRKSSARITHFFGYTIVTIVILICVIPFWMIIIGSVTDESEIISEGYKLFPEQFSLTAYARLFKYPMEIVNAYFITIVVSFTGVFFGLLSMSAGAYVLSRNDFRYRNFFSFAIYFTALFPGGLVPLYLLVITVFRWKNNILALIIPMMMTPYWIIILRTFMKTIPFELVEAAKIDGASEYLIFFRIIMPLAKAGLAVIGLFLGIFYWNNWRSAMLFMTKSEMYPIQYFLYIILQSVDPQGASGSVDTDLIEAPVESLKMALAVIATVPTMLAYPFVQRYFVKGITIGAVKG